jgi:hypothetical protein
LVVSACLAVVVCVLRVLHVFWFFVGVPAGL